MVHEHDDADRRFRAALQGQKLQDRHGRIQGVRGDHMSRMRQRRGMR